jgi:hypothetical protein
MSQSQLKKHILKLRRVDFERNELKSKASHAIRKTLGSDFLHCICKELQVSLGINCWFGLGSNTLNSKTERIWTANYRCVSPQCQARFKCYILRNQKVSTDDKIELIVEVQNLSDKPHAKRVKKPQLVGEKRKQALLEVKATSVKRVVNKNIIANQQTGAEGINNYKEFTKINFIIFIVEIC